MDSKAKKSAQKTIIKLNNIPHGFYEDQMQKYFSQFGKVKRVLLIRSKKTHKSRGFGFVEFQLPQVAKAAAEAMHNYLFFNQVLKCRLMSVSEVGHLFNISYKGPNSVKLAKQIHNRPQRSEKKLHKHYRKILNTSETLKGLGINFRCHIINKLHE